MQLKQYIRFRFLKLFFTKKKQIEFLQVIAALHEVGVSPYNAVKHIAQTNPKNLVLKNVTKSLLANMDKGLSFEFSISDWFLNEVVMIISASAGTMDLQAGINAAIEYITQQAGILKFFLQQVTYPLFLWFLSISSMVTIRTQILDDIHEKAKGKTLPYNLQKFVNISDFFIHKSLLLLIILIIFIIVIKYILKNYTGKYRKKLDALPLFSFQKEKTAFTIVRSLGILLGNHVGILKALTLIKDMGCRYQRFHVSKMFTNMRSGNYTLARILRTGLLNEAHLNKIELMGFTSAVEKTLQIIAKDIFDSMVRLQKALTIIFAFCLYGSTAYNVFFTYTAIMEYRRLAYS